MRTQHIISKILNEVKEQTGVEISVASATDTAAYNSIFESYYAKSFVPTEWQKILAVAVYKIATEADVNLVEVVQPSKGKSLLLSMLQQMFLRHASDEIDKVNIITQNPALAQDAHNKYCVLD